MREQFKGSLLADDCVYNLFKVIFQLDLGHEVSRSAGLNSTQLNSTRLVVE